MNINSKILTDCLTELDIEIGNNNFNILFKQYNITFSKDDIKQIVKKVGGKKKNDIVKYITKNVISRENITNYYKYYTEDGDDDKVSLKLIYNDIKNVFKNTITYDYDTFKDSIKKKVKVEPDDKIKMDTFIDYIFNLSK